MPRNPCDVIDAIVACIPENEETALQSELANIRRDAAFVAPECMGKIWGRMGNCLGEHLGVEMPTDGWKLKVANIVQGKE